MVVLLFAGLVVEFVAKHRVVGAALVSVAFVTLVVDARLRGGKRWSIALLPGSLLLAGAAWAPEWLGWILATLGALCIVVAIKRYGRLPGRRRLSP